MAGERVWQIANNVRMHFHFVDQMRGEGTLARTRPHSFLHSLFSPFNLLSLIECLSLMLISVTLRVIWQFRFSCRDTMNATMRMTKNDVVQNSSESLALPNGMDNMTWHLLVHEDQPYLGKVGIYQCTKILSGYLAS